MMDTVSPLFNTVQNGIQNILDTRAAILHICCQNGAAGRAETVPDCFPYLVLVPVFKYALVWTGSAPCHQQPRDDLPEEPRADQTEERELDQTLSSPIITAHNLDAATENCISCPTPASQGDIPNGTDTPRWSPESTNLDCTVDEGRPLIGLQPESVELTVWSSGGRGETREAAREASDQGRCCCHCCQCKCCQSGRVPAFFSVLASLLCAAGIFYALYFYVPIKPPDCPDTISRIVFTLCCCMVASIPVLLGTLQTPAH